MMHFEDGVSSLAKRHHIGCIFAAHCADSYVFALFGVIVLIMLIVAVLINNLAPNSLSPRGQ